VPVPRFGELEAVIMERVWAADGPVRVRDVVEDLRQNREIAYTTVQTVMEILRHKGWLEREKDGRAHRYWAPATADDYTAQLMDEALDQAPDRSSALMRFVERMDPDEVEQLRRAVDQARSQHDVGSQDGAGSR
jgi:predicted transcriptional regulator